MDPSIPPATDDEPGKWEYRILADVDLNGDGITERVTVLANVAVADAGDPIYGPIWGSGREWEVRVEEADGTRTRLYARFLEYGKLTARIVEVDGGFAVLLTEETNTPHFHLPLIIEPDAGLGIYEVRYRGPGDVVAVELARRSIKGYFIHRSGER